MTRAVVNTQDLTPFAVVTLIRPGAPGAATPLYIRRGGKMYRLILIIAAVFMV